jgi:hypothetical protein
MLAPSELHIVRYLLASLISSLASVPSISDPRICFTLLLLAYCYVLLVTIDVEFGMVTGFIGY